MKEELRSGKSRIQAEVSKSKKSNPSKQFSKSNAHKQYYTWAHMFGEEATTPNTTPFLNFLIIFYGIQVRGGAFSFDQSAVQLCSTISRTLLLYSRLFSLNIRAASEFAGEFGFGSQSSDCGKQKKNASLALWHKNLKGTITADDTTYVLWFFLLLCQS